VNSGPSPATTAGTKFKGPKKQTEQQAVYACFDQFEKIYAAM